MTKKIIVFSDSHGCLFNMKEAMKKEKGISLVFHLGDVVGDIDDLMHEYPQIPSVSVAGNCDMFMGLPDFMLKPDYVMESVDGINIFATHGHKYNVKLGNSYLIHSAVKNNADIILYGHTHEPLLDEKTFSDGKHVYILNPGSCKESVSDPLYGEIIISDGKIESVKLKHIFE